MKFNYSVLILSSLLAFSIAETQSHDKALEKVFEKTEKLFCVKEITDDQLKELLQKCKPETPKELTARDRVTALCTKEHKDCMLNAWKEELKKTKTSEEDLSDLTKLYDIAMSCAKTVLKIKEPEN